MKTSNRHPNVLGLCSFTHDSSAALISGGRLTGMAEEERLSGVKHTREYTTTRRRARESAGILSGKLGLPVHIEPGLTGPHHSDADGHPWGEIKTAFGGPPSSDPDRSYAPGSETWNQYLARASAILADVVERHHGQRILIAGHGETTDAAAMLFLDLTPATAPGPGSRPATRPSPAGT